jgi:hypothetical protein
VPTVWELGALPITTTQRKIKIGAAHMFVYFNFCCIFKAFFFSLNHDKEKEGIQKLIGELQLYPIFKRLWE